MINKLVEHMSSAAGIKAQSSILQDECDTMSGELYSLEKLVGQIHAQVFGPKISECCDSIAPMEPTLLAMLQDKRFRVSECIKFLDEVACVLKEQLGDIRLYQ